MTADPTTTESTRWLPGLHQDLVSPETLAVRRRRVAAAIGPDGVALLQGAAHGPGIGLFRQSNEFHHLTGVEVPGAFLTIAGGTGGSVLYLPHRDPDHARVIGERLHADDPDRVAALVGVEEVRPVERLAPDLAWLLLPTSAPRLWVPHRPAELAAQSRDDLLAATAAALADPWSSSTTRSAYFLQRLRDAFPDVVIADLSPVLDRLREVKDAEERRLLRRAGALTAAGITEAMRSTRVGVHEYQLAAVASFVFLAGGARGEGYRAIVAGGTNAWHGHYGRQADRLADGDLVLMDYAPDVGYYTSDIGRMWPVNGTFSPAHRALYSFIVAHHRALLRRIRAGAVVADILDDAKQELLDVHARTDFARESHARAALAALDFRGALSHPVGMSVHDVGEYRSRPLEAGAVISVDPMIWVEDERQYVRCEDTVVITEDGIENLTAAAPLDCDEIEAVMREPGLLQAWADPTGEG